jgi:hypothetical protein
MRTPYLLLFLLALPGVTATADEASPAAAQLGGVQFTPLGAERAGNAAGSIPPWEGGITAPPADYVPGEIEVDPFPDDAVLYTITADNLAAYADKLSPGQQALLRAHPGSWYMPVYRTRRSASYPDWVYKAVEENARTATLLTAGKGGVAGANVSSPFPIPASGVEVVWNHNLRWRGIRVQRSFGQAAVTLRGHYTVTLQLQDFAFPYAAHPEDEIRTEFPNMLLALKSKTIAPGLISGDGGLVLEPIDQTHEPRKSWRYYSNLRRILRTPYLANAYPAADTDNLRTVDEFDMFNGSPSEYDWELKGKQELYIPYNAYRLHAQGLEYDDIVNKQHINPELTRYELHRVWVVEGTLKPEKKHIYGRRVFYVDEDSWQIAVADNYDLEGNLWRTSEAHALNYYEVPVLWSTLEVYYDLKEGRYLVSGMDNRRNPYRFTDSADPREFSPNALNYYIR